MDFTARRVVLSEMVTYSINDNEWSTLPRPMVVGFGLGQLSGKLITVGGGSEGQSVSNVYQFNEESQQWEESPIPPMPTLRVLPCVIIHQSNVAACGGFTVEEEYSAAVEVFMSSTSQWHRAAPLPIPGGVTQCTVTQDTCYLGGMVTSDESFQRHVFSASLSRLFQTLPCDQQPSALNTWTSLPDHPYFGSALANMGGTLLAIGGAEEDLEEETTAVHEQTETEEDLEEETTAVHEQTETEEDLEEEATAVHAYCPSTSSWVQVGTTPLPCAFSTAQLLPSGQLMLIGGVESKKSAHWNPKTTIIICTTSKYCYKNWKKTNKKHSQATMMKCVTQQQHLANQQLKTHLLI